VHRAGRGPKENPIMNDLLSIGITVAFFALAAAYAAFCEKIR
jgi:hypothetical protein